MSQFRFPESAAHGGRLFYCESVPVLVVDGGPAAVGRQVGELALGPAARLLGYPFDYLRSQVRVPLLPRLLWRLLRRPCRRLFANMPADYRTELETAAGADRDRLVMANTLFDLADTGLRPLFGCSSVVGPPDRSATGGLLFGRNLDFEPLGYLPEYSLVTVYRPTTGRLGIASIGFPGMVGCFFGMNAVGLCLTRHEVLGVRGRRTSVRHARPPGDPGRLRDRCRVGPGLADVWAALGRVHEGRLTIESMLFEPACEPSTSPSEPARRRNEPRPGLTSAPCGPRPWLAMPCRPDRPVER